MFLLRPFVFLRHGSTDWNQENRLLGQQDIPLNDRGCEQAKEASQILTYLQFSMIVCSPLQRCQQTADIINEKLNLPTFTHEGLMEANLGEKEGHLKNDSVSFQAWQKEEAPASGEAYSQFKVRVLKSVEDIFTISQYGFVLVIAHGGVFEAIRDNFQMPEFYLPCATPVVVYPRLDAIILEKKNCVVHTQQF